jgi:vacuolar-type H+-ATPase subunit I/STV1
MSTELTGSIAADAQRQELFTRPRKAAEEAAPQGDARTEVQGGAQAAERPDTMADYVVELSEAARRLSRQGNPFAKALNGATGAAGSADEQDDDSANSVTRQIQEIKKRIEALRKELDEINQSEGTLEEKRSKAAVKEAEIAALQAQLMELMKKQGGQSMPAAPSGGSAFYNTGSLT